MTIYIPVRLARNFTDTETNCGAYSKGTLGFVCKRLDEEWFFRPHGTRDDFGFYLEQREFRVIRNMKSEPQGYLRASTVPYRIIYRDVICNGKNSITEEADQAINLLVRYAEECEKLIKELEHALANTQQS